MGYGIYFNEKLEFNQCANRVDKIRNYNNILVIDIQLSNEDSNHLKKS